MLRKTSEEVEVEVKASINEAWEVYSTFKFGKIVELELAHIFKVQILEGDWGVGSIFEVTIVHSKPCESCFTYLFTLCF